MLKTFRFGERLCRSLRNTVHKRLFLSQAYQCQEAWNRRLESEILKKVNPSDFFFEIDRKFTSDGKVSAVDVDIFAHVVNEDYHVDELLNLLYKLRLSPETSNMLDSTHHAVCRFLLERDRVSDLLEVLNDRLNYGIFPDYFCYNLMIDRFIKQNDFASAAKVATLLMLQEDTNHPLTNALCIYSCHRYLENPDSWKLSKPEPISEDEEEVKVRVRYLRNPYFDDHFDLVEPRDLVGKTLAFQGRHMNDCLGRTIQLRGLVLYKKYNTAVELVKKWIENIKEDIVYADVFDIIEKDNNYIPKEQLTEELKNLSIALNDLKRSSVYNGNLAEAIENKVRIAVNEHIEKDITEQCQTYLKWEEERMLQLQKQIADLDKQARLARVEQLKKDLEERETLLTFFEQEEKIELQIEEKLRKEAEEEQRIKSKFSEAKRRRIISQQEYIPPEIQRN